MQRKTLTRLRRFATTLTFLLAVIYGAAYFYQDRIPALAWLRAFSEAALVGALADWFAVTALFRRPFGLPIPHTAVIPRSRPRIAANLGSFIQSNFLSKEVVAGKLEQLNIAHTAAAWLAAAENRDRAVGVITDAIPEVLILAKDVDVSHFLAESLLSALEKIEIGPFTGSLLESLTEENRHQELVNQLLIWLESYLEENEDAIRARIQMELPWYVPKFVEKKVYEMLVTKAHETLAEVNADPRHPLRLKFDAAIQELIDKLKTSPDFQRKAAAIRDVLLSNPILHRYVADLSAELTRKFDRDLRSPESSFHRFLNEAIGAVSKLLLGDETVQRKLNGWITAAAAALLVRYEDAIIKLISDTVLRWDAQTIVDKVELQVGADLQYIRLNGAIVGGLAGLVIFALSTFLGAR